MSQQDLDHIQDLLGYRFENVELLVTALTHASRADHRLQSNERLEFLGDAVLGLVTCEYLYENFPDLLEGEMTKIKSSVVSRRLCAEIAFEMNLGEMLQLGKGMTTHESLPASVVAAVYESLIGAIFADGGIEPARQFVLNGLESHIREAARSGHQYNFKSALQQAAQTKGMDLPQYLVLDEKGPDHAKCFEVCVEIGGRRFNSCWGQSKKQAEQAAALEALVELQFARRRANGEIDLISTNAELDGRLSGA